MSPRGVTFELERFSVSPITADVILLEVEGRLAGAPARSAAPRLLVERAGGGRREHAPVEAIAQDGLLRAGFAVPAGDVETAALALAVGGLLLDLPAPDVADTADRTVALSREVNRLRHELTELRREAAAGRAAVAGHAAELERIKRSGVEHEAAADRGAAERVAEAERTANQRVAEAERAASERQAGLARAAAKRQAELEHARTELERELAEARERAEHRDAAAATERARVEGERDAANAEAAATTARAADLARREQAARAEIEALRGKLGRSEEEQRAAALAQGPRTRAQATPAPADIIDPPDDAPGGRRTTEESTTAAPRTDDDDPTEEHPVADEPAERPLTDDSTDEAHVEDHAAARAPREDATVAVAPPEDTGPIPLRRVRRSLTVPVAPEDGAQRDAPLPPGPGADPDPAPSPSTRTLALVVLAIAALLFLVAILGFLL